MLRSALGSSMTASRSAASWNDVRGHGTWSGTQRPSRDDGAERRWHVHRSGLPGSDLEPCVNRSAEGLGAVCDSHHRAAMEFLDHSQCGGDSDEDVNHVGGRALPRRPIGSRPAASTKPGSTDGIGRDELIVAVAG